MAKTVQATPNRDAGSLSFRSLNAGENGSLANSGKTLAMYSLTWPAKRPAIRAASPRYRASGLVTSSTRAKIER